MDTTKIKNPISQFVKNIPASIKVDQVIVFGSYLEGAVTEDSDLDLIVVSDDFRKFNEDQRLRMLHDACDNIEPIIDPWGFTNSELEKASTLTTLGYARESGARFL